MATFRELLAEHSITEQQAQECYDYLALRGANLQYNANKKQPGDIVWVNIERAGPTTTVPADGCYIVLRDPCMYTSGAFDCEVLTRHYSNYRYIYGGELVRQLRVAGRTAQYRINVPATLDEECSTYSMGFMHPVFLFRAILNRDNNYDNNMPGLYAKQLEVARRNAMTEAERLAERAAQERKRYLAGYRLQLKESMRLATLATQPITSHWRDQYMLQYAGKVEPFVGKVGLSLRQELKLVGQRIAGLVQLMNTPAEQWREVVVDVEQLYNTMRSGSNRWNAADHAEQTNKSRVYYELLEHFHLSRDVEGMWYSSEDLDSYELIDGNAFAMETVEAIVARGDMVEVLDRNGAPQRAVRGYSVFYEWSDGTYRRTQEPPIIGDYHTSKHIVGRLPHITGHECVGLKAGIELEFVNKLKQAGDTRQKKDNYYAKKLRAAAEPLERALGYDGQYCAFERDGTVDFEMVTGFGPLDTHRAFINAMLAGNPYAGELESHNGGKCGLHVHLDKPQSLRHAQRLLQFWHNPMNENLIVAVARRYGANERYCKSVPGKGNTGEIRSRYVNVKNSMFYKTRGLTTTEKRKAIKRVIAGLSETRYETVNFLPERTVEIRAFRGSMIASTVIACIEFAYLTWYFCRDTPAYKLTTDEFLAYISRVEWRHETAYLRRYLHGKGFKVWVPKKAVRQYAVEA